MNSSRHRHEGNGDRGRKKEVDELTRIMKQMSLQQYTFKTKIGTEEGPEVQIEKLVDIHNQDIAAWVENLKNVKNLSNMDDNVAKGHLKILVDTKLHDIFDKKLTMNTQLKALTDHKYNKNYLQRKLKEIERMTVGRFQALQITITSLKG